MNLRAELERRLSAALAAAGGQADAAAMVSPSMRAEFGDYQANGVMAAAKRLKINPRQLAEKVRALAAPALADLAERVEVAGPGFLNVRLRTDWLSGELMRRLADERLGVQPPASSQRVVVDYSAPNLAKEMHVGHLRSTIIGDALARVLGFLGHEVIRQNHVGDWGTQFGMLIAYAEEVGVKVWVPDLSPDGRTVIIGGPDISDMEEFYRQAKEKFDKDQAFAQRARDRVVQLQRGEVLVKARWEYVVSESLRHAGAIYKRLGILLTEADVRGESAYNDDLPIVIADLDAAGLLSDSQGAQCVFLDEFKGKDDEPLPMIVRKSDEGYLYATTDLAAIRYRVRTLHADRVLYVVDARQSLHFRQLFAVARKAGFAPESLLLEHVAFGTMMGDDGKPFKTRSGGTVKLTALLDEAEQRAMALVSEKSPELPEAQRREIARVVGIGAVKYADLSQNRASDYVFSWDKMLSLEGNTAPYMQYAYARVQSIFRKGKLEAGELAGQVALAAPAERELGLKLAWFPETIDAVARECLPNILCNYLYELAGAFMSFYESCPVLKADDPATRASRLLLCQLTARTIAKGLDLLGIQTVEQM